MRGFCRFLFFFPARLHRFTSKNLTVSTVVSPSVPFDHALSLNRTPSLLFVVHPLFIHRHSQANQSVRQSIRQPDAPPPIPLLSSTPNGTCHTSLPPYISNSPHFLFVIITLFSAPFNCLVFLPFPFNHLLKEHFSFQTEILTCKINNKSVVGICSDGRQISVTLWISCSSKCCWQMPPPGFDHHHRTTPTTITTSPTTAMAIHWQPIWPPSSAAMAARIQICLIMRLRRLLLPLPCLFQQRQMPTVHHRHCCCPQQLLPFNNNIC